MYVWSAASLTNLNLKYRGPLTAVWNSWIPAATPKPCTGNVLSELVPSLEKSKYNVPVTSVFIDTITSGWSFCSHSPVNVALADRIAVVVLPVLASTVVATLCTNPVVPSEYVFKYPSR